MSKPVFLDWASTSPIVKYPCSNYGPFMNVNANYAYKEKKLLKECEDRVKKAIGAKSGKVIFGGTSSQLIENLFTHIYDETNEYLTICSVYEHDAMWRFADQWGNIDSLKHVIQTYHGDKQLIVCLMGVNNLTGEIMPIEEIGSLCRKHGAFCICDMTAMIGKAPISDNIDQWCDCAVWSSHKLGTELGIGAMWISDRLDKRLNGFKLHGTPNLAGALAMAQAVEDACDSHKLGQNMIHYGELLDHMIDGLIEKDIDFQLIPEYEDNEPSNKFALAINAIRLPGFNADVLQQFLASKQVYVSIGGSACAEKHDYRVLENGYNLTKQEASEVIRVSFSVDSSVEDVEALIEGIKEFQNTYVK